MRVRLLPSNPGCAPNRATRRETRRPPGRPDPSPRRGRNRRRRSGAPPARGARGRRTQPCLALDLGKALQDPVHAKIVGIVPHPRDGDVHNAFQREGRVHVRHALGVARDPVAREPVLMLVHLQEGVPPTLAPQDEIDATKAAIDRRLRALKVDAVLALEVFRRWERVARVPLDPPRRQQRRTHALLLDFFALAVDLEVPRLDVPGQVLLPLRTKVTPRHSTRVPRDTDVVSVREVPLHAFLVLCSEVAQGAYVPCHTDAVAVREVRRQVLFAFRTEIAPGARVPHHTDAVSVREVPRQVWFLLRTKAAPADGARVPYDTDIVPIREMPCHRSFVLCTKATHGALQLGVSISFQRLRVFCTLPTHVVCHRVFVLSNAPPNIYTLTHPFTPPPLPRLPCASCAAPRPPFGSSP